MDKLTTLQAAELSDNKVLEILKTNWSFGENENIIVWGKFNIGFDHTNDRNFYTIKEVKTKDNIPIEYPISDLIERERISSKGFYLPYEIGEIFNKEQEVNQDLIIECKLILSNKKERLRKNPMMLMVDEENIKILKKIHKNIEPIEDDNYLYIEQNIVNDFIEKNKEKIDIELENLKKDKLNPIIAMNKELKDSFKSGVIDLKTLNNDISGKQEVQNNLQLDLQKIMDDIELKKNDILVLTEELEQLRDMKKEEKKLMAKKLEKLRDFIKNKADTLLDLDFIDQDEYNDLLFINNETKDSDEKFVSFEEDLSNDKQELISHIQAYLFNRDIVYPRDIIEDFYALVQTNDLIVLAGESGSGKTNLIKSFAKAIGGVSRIIPVKPNWTSSEDLLGYYNPLEKKYLSTPFLDALLEAKNNPDIPYFICLDEMNLARVEYYFADFLSLLEERGEQPEIKLYSEDESSHINSELKMVLSLIESTKDDLGKNNIDNYVDILKDKEINQELKRVFGFSDKDSLIKYHSDLKRMLSGILGTPSSILFPKNVRIIGAINIDETTHYLSPKILDRAHIMKFDSPLLYDWTEVESEIQDVENKELKVRLKIEDLGTREEYPAFSMKDEFCEIIIKFTKEYFTPLGIEVGLRTIRQGLNYKKIFIDQGSNQEMVLNNYILHKILPKLNFEGNKVIDENDTTKLDILQKFTKELKIFIEENENSNYRYAVNELEHIVQSSEMNDGIVNYWA